MNAVVLVLVHDAVLHGLGFLIPSQSLAVESLAVVHPVVQSVNLALMFSGVEALHLFVHLL